MISPGTNPGIRDNFSYMLGICDGIISNGAEDGRRLTFIQNSSPKQFAQQFVDETNLEQWDD
jgi:hypothetical protein